MKIVIDIPEDVKDAFVRYGSQEDVIATAIANGTPLPEDAEILTAEAYSELCLMASKAREYEADVEGTVAESETFDNDDCMFGDYMSPIV